MDMVIIKRPIRGMGLTKSIREVSFKEAEALVAETGIK